MRKILLITLAILFTFLLFGCEDSQVLNNSEYNVRYVDNQYVSMELVWQENRNFVYRDRTTDVLYLVVGGYNGGCITPILNSDGTPKLYGH